ncbi:SDR family NAD(P)-dependent oxidoreductase [Corynebacterium sp. S7]
MANTSVNKQVTYNFSGKVALVTGAGSGMGLATARAFAGAGAAVALVDKQKSAVQAVADELRAQGYSAVALEADVTDEAQVAAAVEATVREFGRIDMAFNNAGIMNTPVDAAEETGEAYDQVVDINLRGVWASTKHELRFMREQGAGTIVNCSSLGGLRGGPGRAAYHASKHGVIGYSKSVAVEYAARGIRVNVVCPGTIETPMVDRMTSSGELDTDATLAITPMGRYGKSEEIAEAVLWLCSDAASYVTGVALPVDGGYVA